VDASLSDRVLSAVDRASNAIKAQVEKEKQDITLNKDFNLLPTSGHLARTTPTSAPNYFF
jgi:hypothetical protein